jgi:hypothetical protein
MGDKDVVLAHLAIEWQMRRVWPASIFLPTDRIVLHEFS